jgi:drug/metabolite transporter (DMT)-like permease
MNPYVYPIFAVIAWGCNFTLLKALVAYVPAHAMNGVRTLIAGIIFLALWRFSQRLGWRDWLLLIAIGIVANSGYQFLFLQGVNLLPATYNTMIAATNPIWAVLIGALFFRERLSVLGYVGMAISLGGIFVLTGDTEGEVPWVGVLFALGATIIWAWYSAITRPLSGRYTLLTWTGLGFVVGLVPYWVFSAPQVAAVEFSSLPPLVWLGIVLSAVMANCMAFLSWTKAIQLLGAVRIAVFQNLVPVIGVSTSVLFLREPFTKLDVVAAALVLVGVLVTQRAKSSLPTLTPVAKPEQL